MNSNLITGTKEEMLNAEFWIRKIENHNKIIMSGTEIDKFNKMMIDKVEAMQDLSDFKSNISKEEILNYIIKYKRPVVELFDEEGLPVKEEFYKSIESNRNIEDIKEVNPVKYGIAVTNTRLRSFPTDKGVYRNDNTSEFDRFQQTACQALQPVLMLHVSKDEEWFFVLTYNYAGWVKSKDVAISNNKGDVFNYVNTDKFIVVTGNFIRTQYSPLEWRVNQKEFYMGTRIPLSDERHISIGRQSTLGNYEVKLPVRDKNGKLEFVNALIARSQDVSCGYLPYTRANVLRQIFKLIGDRYDWGDKFNGRDCSSTMMNVYNTFGIKLPRNAGEQERGEGKLVRFEKDSSLDERNKVLAAAKPGAGLYMDGHVMMYLGEDNGTHFMIHNFHGHGIMEGDRWVFTPVNEVCVTPTSLHTSSGKIFTNKFTSILLFE
jgi:hypothetical protein